MGVEIARVEYVDLTRDVGLGHHIRGWHHRAAGGCAMKRRLFTRPLRFTDGHPKTRCERIAGLSRHAIGERGRRPLQRWIFGMAAAPVIQSSHQGAMPRRAVSDDARTLVGDRGLAIRVPGRRTTPMNPVAATI
ncbi:MAG: hypothetical protein SVO96_10315 [Pseudomonadota bacterium]|nr:hypothetical protein [Pseudomonadota bacterium]